MKKERVFNAVVILLLAICLTNSGCGVAPIVMGIGGGVIANEHKEELANIWHEARYGEPKYLVTQHNELVAAAAQVLNKIPLAQRPLLRTHFLYNEQKVAALRITVARHTFSDGSAMPTAATTELLDLIAASLTRYETSRIHLAVHSDLSGTVQANQEISERRAAFVKGYLLSRNVSADRIKASMGLGIQQPWAEAQTQLDHRRIDVVLY